MVDALSMMSHAGMVCVLEISAIFRPDEGRLKLDRVQTQALIKLCRI